MNSDFLKNYDITKYDRPSVAVDIAIFSIMEEECENYRKLPEKKFKILLVKRGEEPYMDDWALPGGFLKRDETLIEAARRELLEETNVEEPFLKEVGTFSDKERDPRGWIISDTFMALVDASRCNLRASSDVKTASWFNVEYRLMNETKSTKGRSVFYNNTYELRLGNYSEGAHLRAVIEEKKVCSDFNESTEYVIAESEGIAFDHAKIIAYVISYLRKNVENSNIAFGLLPEYFTLSDLQKVHEIILDRSLLTANFRRKIADYVVETDKMTESSGHRPAKLFMRNLNNFTSRI